MREILVVANRTLGGAKLLEAVRARAAERRRRASAWSCRRASPSAGLVIYDEAVRESAQVRVDLALSAVAAEGIEATGEVGDPDPFLATMDADRRAPARRDHRLHPPRAVSSGWLRRDLIERIRQRLGPARRAHRRRPRAGGAAVQGDARDRQQDLRRRGADRAPARRRPRDGERAPVHRGRAAARRQRRRAARGARAPGDDARPPARGGPAQLGHDRRPRPLHGRDQRARAVPRRRRRHLDAARRALGLAALRT